MILETDIKLLKSERLQDTDDGGGRMTGNEVVDNLSNNLFPDISELDRTYGRISLRKAFPAVMTETTDTYYGSNVIISEPPADPLVSVVMLDLQDSAAWWNERAAAQDKIESSIVKSVVSDLKLLGDHYEGQRTIFAYQDPARPLPGVGDVLCLFDTAHEQYVRITDVVHEVVTYSDTAGTFLKRQLTLSISSPLLYDFIGGVQTRATSYLPATKLYKTNAIEAVNCYGISPLAEAAIFGATKLTVDHYKGPLIPSTQSESALLDIQAGGTTAVSIATGVRNPTMSGIAHTGMVRITSATRQFVYVNSLKPLPAQYTLVISYMSRGKWYAISDKDGDGHLTGDGTGSLNYITGSVMITLQDLPDIDSAILYAWGSAITYTTRYSAGMEFSWSAQTAHTPVKPGFFSLAWESSGIQYSVFDDGLGNIGVLDANGHVTEGESYGRIDYATGKFFLVPKLLPEANVTPQITYEYGSGVEETYSVSVDMDGYVSLSSAQQITPRTLSITWTVTRPKTHYEMHSVESGSTTTSWGSTSTNSSLTIDPNLSTSEYVVAHVTARDDGEGSLLGTSEVNPGLVNYIAGDIGFWTGVPYVVTESGYEYTTSDSSTGGASAGPGGGGGWGNETTKTRDSLGMPQNPMSVTLRYRPETGTDTQVTETLAPMPIVIDLTPFSADAIVPDSVHFELGGIEYIDMEGEIYQYGSTVASPSLKVIIPPSVGTIDYASGLVTLTNWCPGGGGVLSNVSMLTVKCPWTEANMLFRTPSAPLRPGGFFLSAVDVQGRQLLGTADTSGTITGDHLTGAIDVERGVVALNFGDVVLDASLTAEEKDEPWYFAGNVDANGYIWRPLEVWPETVRYNCVVYVSLPLSSEILGLDPVRLPMDGQMPLFRVGDVVVVHHTATSTPISNPQVGQVIHADRERLAYARLYDAAGALVPTAKYSVDLDAGTATFLDVSGLATPLTLEHRVEDMALVSDLQIETGGKGVLTLTRGLSHAYPLGSYVSSALVIGDMFARVGVFFSQQTWTGMWSDSRIGSNTTAQYNDTVHPVEVTNRGAIQERWMIQFTSSTNFNVIGEYSGQVDSGSINSDCAPINPNTGTPYFTIRAVGWGLGWATGYVVRFNTVAANYPVWIARTILQGNASAHTDRFRLQIRGDADTP